MNFLVTNIINTVHFLAIYHIFGFNSFFGLFLFFGLILYPILNFIYLTLSGPTWGGKKEDTMLYEIMFGFKELKWNEKKITSYVYLVWILFALSVWIFHPAEYIVS